MVQNFTATHSTDGEVYLELQYSMNINVIAYTVSADVCNHSYTRWVKLYKLKALSLTSYIPVPTI